MLHAMKSSDAHCIGECPYCLHCSFHNYLQCVDLKCELIRGIPICCSLMKCFFFFFTEE
jgi:hypothetical protein